MTHIFCGVAWPYANGPRHIGHVAGIGVPPDVFSRYLRMAGHDVLMVSGTDEHGTPILVQAEQEGVAPIALADRYNRVIVEDLHGLGVSYDLFTRTTTRNHYAVCQEMFRTLHRNGYMIERTTTGAISPSSGRTLPDRYIEGTCPICCYDGARGDQCDNCGNQLDACDLRNPRSRINGETPKFIQTEHFFLDLPALADSLGAWLQSRKNWRPSVQRFSLNLLADIRPRAMTRDIDWGIPVPVAGWEDNPNKRLYVWFDAVIGYLSASIEWARRSGDVEAWRSWWNDEAAQAYYFMGKDNITFHAQIWPAELLGYAGKGDRGGAPGFYGELNLPTEVVSSEFLTMEGKQFSSSRGVVIYLRDMLARYQPDALRYFIAVAGPESQDTDFTWVEFVRRTNDELVAGWGNLVNRTASMINNYLQVIPQQGTLTMPDEQILAVTENTFSTVGELLRSNRQKQAITEAMRAVASANKYLSDQAPWKLRNADRDRMATILHVAAQVVLDCNTILSPFLPHSAQAVHEAFGGSGVFAPMPEIREVEDLDGGAAYPVLVGDYRASSNMHGWARVPIVPGTPVPSASPIFRKLEESVVTEEIARLKQTISPTIA